MNNLNNSIQTIEYIEVNKLITQTWKATSENLTAEDFKNQMLELAKYFKELQPEKVLIDMRKFFFAVNPDLQDWVNENVNSKLAKVNAKTAFVVSSDLFTKISVEQTLDENDGAEVNSKFFDDYEDAKTWLIN